MKLENIINNIINTPENMKLVKGLPSVIRDEWNYKFSPEFRREGIVEWSYELARNLNIPQELSTSIKKYDENHPTPIGLELAFRVTDIVCEELG